MFAKLLVFFLLAVSASPSAPSKYYGFNSAKEFFAAFEDEQRSCWVTPFNSADSDYVPDRRECANRTSLTVANFNVNFLFAYETEPETVIKFLSKDYPYHTIENAFEHIEQVAGKIAEMNADIIHLTEVQDCRVLRMLVHILSQKGISSYNPYLVTAQDKYTGQNVGFLTKVDPVEDVTSPFHLYRDYEIEQRNFASKNGRYYKKEARDFPKSYIARFRIFVDDEAFSHHDIVLGGVHLIRGTVDNTHSGESKKRRELQANTFVKMMRRMTSKGNYVIVMGDFNDVDGDVIALSPKKPNSEALEIVKTAASKQGELLLNALNDVEDSTKRFTCANRSHGFRIDSKKNIIFGAKDPLAIDHILYDNRLIVESAQIIQDYNGDDLGTEEDQHLISDHYPMVVSLTFPVRKYRPKSRYYN